MKYNFLPGKFNKEILIRLCFHHSLILFFILFDLACTDRRDQSSSAEITILWRDGRAAGLVIPNAYVKTINSDSIFQLVHVRMVGAVEQPAILGEYKIGNDEIIFEPLIPFTPGLRYEVIVRNNQAIEIEIPKPDAAEGPVLLAVYPTQDTVPLNLLKIYLHFSKPMREGQSLQHITLLKNDRDTVRGVFLNLQPELWNADQTLLTVWLDPGRIKRDLQPNKLLGTPLQQGEHYSLIVSDQWKDTRGLNLQKAHKKTFMVSSRDSISPNPQLWKIHSPKAGTAEALELNFTEPLDYSLLNEALSVVDETGKNISVKLRISVEEKRCELIPQEPWRAGSYRLEIETRLEDLAGNNLNRPFDRDLRNKNESRSSAEQVSMIFRID